MHWKRHRGTQALKECACECCTSQGKGGSANKAIGVS